MDFKAILAEFCAAVEAGDGRRLAALFTPDGVYHDVFYGAFKGREKIAELMPAVLCFDFDRPSRSQLDLLQQDVNTIKANGPITTTNK